jgi:RNA polymerase sigma-70 factor, ECF subfamily
MTGKDRQRMMIDWKAILAEHGPAVWGTIYRLLDHEADALDCYQETFLAAWQFARRQAIANWACFLTALATRRAVDKLRERYRLRSRFTELTSAVEPSIEVSPLKRVMAAETLDQIRVELANLPGKQAEVFWLSHVEELTHQEISDSMAIPPGEVRVLLHRARSRLRDLLETIRVDERE